MFNVKSRGRVAASAEFYLNLSFVRLNNLLPNDLKVDLA